MKADPLMFETAIQILRTSSLLSRNSESKILMVHRLVQEIIKDQMDKDEQRRWAELVVQTVNGILRELERAKLWTQYGRYLPQVQMCSTLIQEWNIASVEANELIYYLNHFPGQLPLSG
jgi:hypothetical protein